jgi:DNA-binding MarR family transcriptional regulator
MNKPKPQIAKAPTAKKSRSGKGAASQIEDGPSSPHDLLDEIRAEWIASGRHPGNFDFSQFVLGFTIVSQLMEREFNRYTTAKFGMSPSTIRILLTLRRAGRPMRPTDLFKQLIITPGAITKQVDRLEARGFVRRVFNSESKRGFLIVITKAGLTITDQATSNEAMPTMWEIFHKLTDAQRSEALGILHLLIGEIREQTQNNPID